MHSRSTRQWGSMGEKLYRVEVTVYTVATGRTPAEAEKRVERSMCRSGLEIVEFGDTEEVERSEGGLVEG